MVSPTTSGLSGAVAPSDDLPLPQWAIAAGLADQITAAYDPAVTDLQDGLALCFRAVFTTLTTTPTFSPDEQTPMVITKQGGSALAIGDIYANGEYLVRLNKANSRWELVNR